MTPQVELGFIEKLKSDLHDRVLELEGAVAELSLTKKAYLAIGGTVDSMDPVEVIVQLRAEIEVIEAERQRLQLELQDNGNSAGGQNVVGVEISAVGLADLKRQYESAMADRTSLMTAQAQLMRDRDDAQEIAERRGRELGELHRELGEAQRCADTFETEIATVRGFLETAVADKERLTLELRNAERGEIDFNWSPTNLPPGTPCGTAEARSNKGIGANAPYFISPSEQGLRDEFDIGYTWAVFKIHGNLLLCKRTFTPEDIAAIPADESPAPEGDGGKVGGYTDSEDWPEPSAEAAAVHGDRMEESAAAFIAPEVNARKAPVSVTLEQARDFIVDVIGMDTEFPTTALSQHFNISDSQARDLCSKLAQQRIIMRPGAVVGRNARWKYNGEIPPGPTTKPRGERLLDAPAQRRAGAPVPGTGVPAGQAESPGKLKRQQKKAARVKTKPVKGVRV